nr:esterase-like activity of phytase family protein [Novosphingobium jiangmenense]
MCQRACVRKVLAFLLLLLPLLWLSWTGPRPNPNLGTGKVLVEDILAEVPAAERAGLAPFAIEGLWRISGTDRFFGGYSALVQSRSGGFLAISDRNRVLSLPLPPRTGWSLPKVQRAVSLRLADGRYFGFDVESAVRDPDGALWLGLEDNRNVVRVDTRLGKARLLEVPEIADWPRNGGTEAMARLPDGRWAMLCESCGTGRGGLHLGLIFPGHPGETKGQPFGVIVPPGFDPVDAVALPDGRLLLLVRRFAFLLPHFEARLVLADLRRLDPTRPLRTQQLATLDGPYLRENWEGMTLVPEGKGHALWLITDANDSAFQETRLMKLRLPERF